MKLMLLLQPPKPRDRRLLEVKGHTHARGHADLAKGDGAAGGGSGRVLVHVLRDEGSVAETAVPGASSVGRG